LNFPDLVVELDATRAGEDHVDLLGLLVLMCEGLSLVGLHPVERETY
jgi:hypothetical protein